MNTCNFCNKETSNPKFCSRSCSAKNSNSVSPRRIKTKVCAFKDCEITILSSRKYCTDHKNKFYLKFKTMGELRESAKGVQVNSYARGLAREWARKNLDCSGCWYCGYSTHVEVCHIKDVALFSDETYVSETYENNVIILCRNHHWEYDNGYLAWEPEKGFEPSSSNYG